MKDGLLLSERSWKNNVIPSHLEVAGIEIFIQVITHSKSPLSPNAFFHAADLII